jgi:CheY-like chemotaxis protein
VIITEVNGRGNEPRRSTSVRERSRRVPALLRPQIGGAAAVLRASCASPRSSRRMTLIRLPGRPARSGRPPFSPRYTLGWSMANGFRATVLVVDDEAAIRDSLRMILEYEGYRVEEAGSGSQALARPPSAPPDAVLLDIKMPEMDGLEVLTAFRERGYDMPVLMISGHADVRPRSRPPAAAPTTSSRSRCSASGSCCRCATPSRATGWRVREPHAAPRAGRADRLLAGRCAACARRSRRRRRPRPRS